MPDIGVAFPKSTAPAEETIHREPPFGVKLFRHLPVRLTSHMRYPEKTPIIVTHHLFHAQKYRSRPTAKPQIIACTILEHMWRWLNDVAIQYNYTLMRMEQGIQKIRTSYSVWWVTAKCRCVEVVTVRPDIFLFRITIGDA